MRKMQPKMKLSLHDLVDPVRVSHFNILYPNKRLWNIEHTDYPIKSKECEGSSIQHAIDFKGDCATTALSLFLREFTNP